MPASARSQRVSIADVLRFVWSYWRELPVRFALIVGGVLTAVALEIQIPNQVARLTHAVEQFMDGAADLSPAWASLVALVALYFFVMLAQQFYLRLWMYFASEVMQKIVYDGFRRVQRFSTDWHANHFAGSTVRRITRGMWAYDSLADLIVVDLGPAFILLFGFSVAMALRDPWMGLFFVVSVGIFVCASSAMSLWYVAPANKVSNDADTAVGGALADAVTCNPVVKSFGAEDREDSRLFDVTGHWRRSARTAWTKSIDAGAAQSLMLMGLLGGLLSMVLALAGSGRASLADIMYVIATYFVVAGHLRTIGWQVRNLQRAVNELDDLVDVAHTIPQVPDAPGAREFVPGPGAIEFAGVGFRYRNQPDAVFSELDVRIAPGEKVALVGESGAGKTTFVKLVQRLYDVDRGVIRIDGQDVSRVTQDSLRRALALVPQEPILFHRTLAENIRYGRPGASDAEVVLAARQAHAHEFIERLESGYETLVGERGIKLSGGERQRVALARAILADAPILVLDEATSSLDSITEHWIQDAIRSLIEGRTAILIAHRLSTIRRVDRILVFEAGRIVEEGSHDALMANADGHYRRMFDMQTLGFIDDLADAPPARRQSWSAPASTV
jgi:ATP-binding cassette subfamily B protein